MVCANLEAANLKGANFEVQLCVTNFEHKMYNFVSHKIMHKIYNFDVTAGRGCFMYVYCLLKLDLQGSCR